jgi:hypothetical protein
VNLINQKQRQIPVCVFNGSTAQLEKVAYGESVRPQVAAWMFSSRRQAGRTGKFSHDFPDR